MWTCRALRIIDAFFVRTTYDAVGHGDTLHCMRTNELQNLFADVVIAPHIGSLAEPSLKKSRFLLFGEHDADGDLGCHLVIGSIERDGGSRISGETTIGLLSKRLGESLLQRQMCDPRTAFLDR